MAAAQIIEKEVQLTTYLLLGKTGIGKSTTGNKMLGIYDSEKDKEDCGIFECHSKFDQTHSGINDSKEGLKFEEGDLISTDTTTRKCKLLGNHKLQIKVLDVPGFSSTFQESGDLSVYSLNMSIFHQIVSTQYQCSLEFSRIVYFLPVRRFPEKGDGLLQEEIKLMHYFFGEDVFKCMVVALTSSQFDDDELHITDQLECHTKDVLKCAIKASTGIDVCSPPIISISLNDTGNEIRSKIKSAKVHSPERITLHLTDDICTKCSTKSKSVCTITRRASIKIDEEKTDKEIEYCHPCMIPEHSNLTKTAGEILKLFTGGAINAFFEIPGIFSDAKVCINCKQKRGKTGCMPIPSTYKGIQVSHTNESQDMSRYEASMQYPGCMPIPNTYKDVQALNTNESQEMSRDEALDS